VVWEGRSREASPYPDRIAARISVKSLRGFAVKRLGITLPAIAGFAFSLSLSGASGPLLLQHPSINKTHIVFSWAGDLWLVPRQGGDAMRLTAGAGNETNPIFSPDGTRIAFQGEYDGNTDVYVISATGGEPKRLTWHPAPDSPVAWTRDGHSIIFRTTRDSYATFPRLFEVRADGGFPTPLDLPMGYDASPAPDAGRLTYMPIAPAFSAWKRYRGGRTTPLWIVRLSENIIERIPRDNSNDFNPMWVEDRVYFLSDRNGPVTLFSYDTRTKKVTQCLANSGLDFKSAHAGPGAIVYEQFGEIHIYDLKSGREHKVDIRISADVPSMRATYLKVASKVSSAAVSPTGVRASFEAHGEILTVAAEKGDIRNLTNTPGVAERNPSWSPDGKRIAFFSDESGEYQLHLRQQTGMGEVEKMSLGDPPDFYYDPLWSPDSKKIVYRDSNLKLWYIDLAARKPVLVDEDYYKAPDHGFNPVWAPDSRWIAYTKVLKNHMRALFVYSLEEGRAHQISDGMSDAEYAAFDANGKYLYFTASTDVGLSNAWLDMSSDAHPVSRSVYVTVLSRNEPSPVAPESDDESSGSKSADQKTAIGQEPETSTPAGSSTPNKDDFGAKSVAAKPVNVHIDFDDIGQRIVALPIPARNYNYMAPGKTGILFLSEDTEVAIRRSGPPPGDTVYKFDLKTRKTDKFVDGVREFHVTFNGEKMLYRHTPNSWAIVPTASLPKPGDGALKLDSMEVRTDPRAEWKQMYNEAWRIERDFFYDPHLHGLNLADYRAKYAKYLDNLSSRADLNYLFEEMLGELTVGHLFVRGGEMPELKQLKGGLLGADYSIENNRYRFAKVYNGENWNPDARAPLTQPGVNVKAGEYLLAVNGRDVTAAENLYSFFEETANKSAVIKVGSNPDGSGAREVVVVPVENESSLRTLAWIEENRRKVDKMSGGKLAYVYLPDTAAGGFTNFNRYYFAQVGKEGVVIDERFNHGGQIADYIIDNLRRTQTNFFMTRAGAPFTTPQGAIFGPKAMIINEYAGSGGDAMPWLFRQEKIGLLIGKRTWGGLVGMVGFPALMDGGVVTAPNLAFYNLKGQWEVENHGVAPDIEVEYDPAAVKAGHDPQLEKAVDVLIQDLKTHPLPAYPQPAFPDYHSQPER
jgi:tricorn protease